MSIADSHPPTTASLDRAHLALAAHRWAEAIELLRTADAEAPLAPADLDQLGQAAWWMGLLGEAIAARERAYAGHMTAGDRRAAAGSALTLAADYSHRLESSIASGWVKRAQRLLDGLPEAREHGYLERALLGGALGRGDLDEALARAEHVLELGNRLADPDLEALGLQDKGRVLVALGRVEEGMALLDEAIVAAISGEVSPYPTAVVYCNATIACEDLADYRRASEFADAAKRWCERQAIAGFPGMCRVRRVEIIRLRGAWAEAEAEARQACAELQEFSLEYAAEGFYQIGEIRLRMGDLAAAEEAFTQAHELGREPLPGLALVRLAQGRTDAAADLLARALGDEALPLARAKLLPAEVEVGVKRRDHARAEAAASELERIAEQYGTHVLRAAATCVRGLVALAGGDSDGAASALGSGWRLWQETDAPYEAARARTWLAEAYLAGGDREAAEFELSAAAAAFERLGAARDTAAVAELREASRREEGHIGSRARGATRTFMFTDIVRSTHLIEAIGDAAWENLLAWHDQTIRGLLRDYGGEEVDHAGDGFFVAFPDADDALACAIAIRRTLAEHRRRQGFAPALRMGLHSADAIKTRTGYEGRGVHVAARIGALAAPDEILASEAVIESASRAVAHGAARQERLRGIRQPVPVVAIEER